MAITETSTPSEDEPLPRRKQLILPEPEIFGAEYSDEQYREELGMYLGQKVIISSVGIRHFRGRHGHTVKFKNDPVSIEKELAPLLNITSLPMTYAGEEALVMPWNHPELGMIEPFVPLSRTVTTIYLPVHSTEVQTLETNK